MEAQEQMREVIRKLNDKIDRLNRKLDSNNSPVTQDETWLDNQAACQFLKISKRTLQSYRNQRVLPYSRIRGKIYYRLSDKLLLCRKCKTKQNEAK